MTTYVALLRGINVGGHRKVPMAGLRAVCAEAGFGDVRSYIQSGNLVLDGAGAPAETEGVLETAIARRFGFAVDVIARTAAQWHNYVASNPLSEAAAAAPSRVMLVLSRPPLDAAAVERLRDRAAGGEAIVAVDDVLWIHFPDGAGHSKLAAALGRQPSTARNWRTVLKLAGMAGG